jgi:AraC family transcriptional regulator
MYPGASPLVPLHHQSPQFHEVDIGPFRVTSARFNAASRIEPHYHDRPNLGVMLAGSFDLLFGAHRFDCEPGTLFFEPAGETHCNCMGCAGASVLALQPDPAHADLERLVERIFREPGSARHPRAHQIGLRISREAQLPDDFSGFMVQSLAFELLAMAGRTRGRDTWHKSVSLARVEALLRDAGAERVTLVDLAREAGVHPAHLARAFRQRFGCSLGRFLLERRLEWAATRLAQSDQPISRIALEAGFADQSHFTRRFRAWAGLTPYRFRASRVGSVPRR